MKSHALQALKNNNQSCKAMIDNFIYQKNDCGAELLSTINRYISYCDSSNRTLSTEDKQDIAQEISIKIFKKSQFIQKNANGWLFNTVKNQYIDKLRQLNVYHRFVEPDSQGNLVNIAEASQCHMTHQITNPNYIESVDCIETIFNNMEEQPKGRDDIKLYTAYIKGLTNEEISQETGRTRGAIAKRLSILRQRVKDLILSCC